MKAFRETFKLEFTAAVRSRALLLLTAVSALWMLVLPRLVASDGTADGAHEIYIRYSLGAVFALLAVTLGASAAGSLSKDRAARRLQLTLVRPVRYFTVALGRTVALTLVGAIVLTVCALLTLVRVEDPVGRSAYHVLSPVLESPRSEAERMYDIFMADPETPPEVKQAKRETVLRLLTQKAVDHYQTIRTNDTAQWTFPSVPEGAVTSLALRLRFSNAFESREEVRGEFSIGDCRMAVSNLTQSVLTLPFALDRKASYQGPLTFRNEGANGVMLRPRRDISLLYGTEWSFFAVNLAMATVELVCMLAAIIAFAMFLGASLGRSVAVFTTAAVLFLTAVSPAVLDQYPDQLETDRKDRIGLTLTRLMRQVTSPVGSYAPIEALSEDVCLEAGDVVRCVAFDLLLLPLLLALAAGVVMPRKQQD